MSRSTLLCLFIGAASASFQLFAGPVPIGKPNHYPDWWFTYDVIARADPENTTPDYIVPGTYPASDDYAAANIGQLKHMAYQGSWAMEEILAPLGAGAEINDFVDVWALNIGGEGLDDFATLNQGQLKAVAKLFYKRLRQIGYSGSPLAPGQFYPWDNAPSPPDSYAAVNLGQLKRIFSFFAGNYFIDSYLADFDLDEMADGWEVEQGLDPSDASDASAINGGITNLQRYRQSLSVGGDPLAANSVALCVYTP